MSVDHMKLRRLWKRDPVTKEILKWLANQPAPSEVTEVETLTDKTRRPRIEIVAALKALQKQAGCGTFIAGRKGKPSRMHWLVDTRSLQGAAASDANEQLVELEIVSTVARPRQPPPRTGPSHPTNGKGGGEAKGVAAGTKYRFPNMETCVGFFASTKNWPESVLAAARAGLWDDDVLPTEWEERLDRLEDAHASVRADGPPQADRPAQLPRGTRPPPPAVHKRP
jgi:hypothetical protein